MKHKNIAGIICFSILTAFLFGCGKTDHANSGQNDTSVNIEDGGFHFELVAESILIKGHHFTLPQKLSELEDGLTYEFIGEEFDDGLYEVEISDAQGVILRSLADNAHHKNGKAFLYNIAIEDSESSVAGITPHITTVDEVIDVFGEPGEIVSAYEDDSIKVYKYGTHSKKSSYRSGGNFINIQFNGEGIVELIVVNYDSSQ